MEETYPVMLRLRTKLAKAYLRKSNISLATKRPQTVEEAMQMQMEDAQRNTHVIQVACETFAEAEVTDNDIAYLFNAKHPVDIVEYTQQSPWQFANGMVVESVTVEFMDKIFTSYEEWQKRDEK